VSGDLHFIGDRPIAHQRLIRTTTDDTEETRFAVVRSPRVASNPIINSVLVGSPSVHLDGVVEEKWLASGSIGSLVVGTDSAGVGVNAAANVKNMRMQAIPTSNKILCSLLGIDTAHNRSAGHDLSLDVLVTPHTSIFL
jgi:hypothetical protein